jgi:glycosyltransferase involved in cell wall biosynthesis
MGFGKLVITPKCGAFVDYIDNGNNGLLINTTKSVAFGSMDSPSNLYTSDEQWSVVDLMELKNTMRNAAEFYPQTEAIRKNAEKTIVEKFNHKTVGEQYLSIL